VNVGTIGHIDHGKTTLTAAITKVLQKHNPKNQFRSSIDRQRAGRAGTWHYDATAHVEYETRPSLRARGLPWARRTNQET